MKESLLGFLVSPHTEEALELKDAQYEEGEIMTGRLCSPSGQEYRIRGGIPRFVSHEHYVSSFGRQWNRFKKTQLDSANGSSQTRETFEEKTGWSVDELEGSTVLEAGCGMGRFLEVASQRGAQVIGVDLSLSVEAAYEIHRAKPNVHIIQSDIFHLPFRKGTFNRIFSIGVLHHTPDPPEAFQSLVPLLVPGGAISVWVYSRNIRNPAALLLSDLYRLVTTKMPHDMLLTLTRSAIPLGYVYRIPILGTLLNTLLPISPHPDPEWRWLDTFDWYSPRYQFKYSSSEVLRWFNDAGLEKISPLRVPVSATGWKIK